MKLVLSDSIGSHKTNIYCFDLLQEDKGEERWQPSCDRKCPTCTVEIMLLMVGIVMGAEVVAGIVDTQMLVESKHSVITCVQGS